tara:strand:+ start:646 stop:1338 length:693 start_codon:yes stop_codon:yes gene_type:complete
MIFSLEGNIGSGKSTILRGLKRQLRTDNSVIFLLEPVDQWEQIKDKNGVGILEKFYGDQERYAFSFQMMAYISRLSLLKKTIRENPGCHVVTERSISTDRNVFAKMLYEDEKIEELNYQIYLKWFDEFVEEAQIDAIIYIRATGETCFERVKKRSRTGESNIPVEYLTRCGEKHDDWILNQYGESKLVLDVNSNTDEAPFKMNEWLNQITGFIYGKIREASVRRFMQAEE